MSILKKPVVQSTGIFYSHCCIHSWTFHTQMFVPAQCRVAPVTRWLPDLHNLSFLCPATWAETFIFSPPEFWEEGGKWVSALCPWRRVTKPGMHRKEVTEARLSLLAPFLYFPTPLFPTPSLSDKGQKGCWSNEQAEPWGGRLCVWVHMCVCMYVVGGLSVSEAAVSPHGLSLITPLTPQEALDVRLAS